MALELGAARVGGPARLGLERLEHRLEARDLAGGHLDRQPAAPGEHPARRRPLGGAAEERLVGEAHGRAVDALGLGEDVHLAPADEREACAAHRQRAAVEEVLAAARAQPEQLVVVVAVRRAGVAGTEAQPVEAHDRDRVGGIGEAVDGQGLAGRGAGGGCAAHGAGSTGSAAASGSRPDQRIDAAAAAASGSRPPTANTAVISCWRVFVPMLDPSRW